jgi:hypothetical protein
LQLEVLKGLKAKGKPLAIGMEMFEGFSQKALDAWSAGKVPTYAFTKVTRVPSLLLRSFVIKERVIFLQFVEPALLFQKKLHSTLWGQYQTGTLF